MMNKEQLIERHSKVTGRILSAAADIFAEKGFAGARMDEVARRAGVNKATIYYHIGDKKKLYAEVIHQVIGSVTDSIEENIRRAETPEEKMVAYIQTVAEAMDTNPQMPPIMMREIASGGGNMPDIFILEDFSRILGIVKHLLDEGAASGVFREASPLLVHLMVASALAVYKMSFFIRERYKGLSGPLLPDAGLVGPLAAQVGALIVKGLRRS